MDFIRLGEWNRRAEEVNVPAIIIPAKRGKVYSIQYAGCGCLQCVVKGNVFELPGIKFGEEGGSIFNPEFWYAHAISRYFSAKSGKYKRSFIYDLIDEEIKDRCTEFGEGKQLFRRIWVTPYTRIKVDRKYPNNNEAMMVVDMHDSRSGIDVKGVLTWRNCD